MITDIEEYRRNILMDFNMIFDTDLGSAYFLINTSKNKELFKEEIFKANIEFFKYKALNRKENNPIEYLFKDEYKGFVEKIYGEMIEKEWGRVLTFSPLTTIYKMVLAGMKYGKYKFTINCRNEQEVQRIKDINVSLIPVIQIQDIIKFSALYIHDLSSVLEREWDIRGKTVFLYNYSKNHFDDDLNNDAPIDLALRWSKTTEFIFINPYEDYINPVG